MTGRFAKFPWTQEREEAFLRLKDRLMTAPVLHLADAIKPLRVITDASDLAVAGVLLQESKHGEWHPVAYMSRRLTFAERNYTATERETLAVVHALQVWRTFLYRQFELLTDNSAVTYLLTKKNLSKCEARWIDFLAEFDYVVHHVPGSANVADSLSRLPDVEANTIEFTLRVNPTLLQDISDFYTKDGDTQVILKRLQRPQRDAYHERYVWDNRQKLLYLKDNATLRLCAPKCRVRLVFMREYHDCVSAGHPGRDRSYARLARFFYWPGMSSDVKKYVATCDSCQRMKGSRLNKGLLQPFPVPTRPWQDISMDFITGLPESGDGYDAILTIVDRLTKCVHLTPVKTTIDAEDTASVYIRSVFRLHGLSRSIVRDRDPRFTAAFFSEVFKLLGTNLQMSTANHPQTDGMTERIHRVVGDILRSFVNHRQDNWSELLPMCEFAINDREQESTKASPFFLNYGQHPWSASDCLLSQFRMQRQPLGTGCTSKELL